ncbi:tRNA (adenosine(37)-N6)-threonylcarbamoyltransferase complex ATPase subunit type 1 TsaE [Halodesulfovibrio spirochaetisodalis]|uniref:tRNA threonylcarbamoyladenosine biosynthesis protein TsaE n=1 Tax=Halodesulfovibrio spirochaetisodalis TaxID=1560234 RepID=A0A1B7XJM0_9BACT|nr:tRNA (adenosine(37)-N6)-threonylcarbamoyltransferase complex ATPase subunit type 1 TsaE [Halodesulfovibrio spirochaetisodalis]OBQ55720.1 ATPase, YjeE family protein [Halodesulfovibrio spirochaetisodalis]
MLLYLKNAEETELLGKYIAQALVSTEPVQTLLFKGTLGSGKTTLVRSLVQHLPGGDEAEVSSPSFNVYNLYPTTPETAHYDLYRLAGGGVDESFHELLDEEQTLMLVEWAENLPEHEYPKEWLQFSWIPCEEGRQIDILVKGAGATRVFEALKPLVTSMLVAP